MTDSLEQTHGIDDDESMEIAENPYVSQNDKNNLLLLDLNLKVAAIAGWTEIKEWERKAVKKAFVGTNRSHPELGIFVPNYTESLDAIWGVFNKLQLKSFNVGEVSELNTGFAYEACISISSFGVQDIQRRAETPAIALCELLIAINPTPSKAETEPAMIEAVLV